MTTTLTRKFVAASAIGIFSLGAAACSSDGAENDVEDPIEDVGDDIEDGGEDVVDEVEDGADEMEEDVEG